MSASERPDAGPAFIPSSVLPFLPSLIPHKISLQKETNSLYRMLTEAECYIGRLNGGYAMLTLED